MSSSSIDGSFEKELAPGQFMEALFSAFPDATFFVKNRKGQLIACNDELVRLNRGRCKDDVLGKTDFERVPINLAEKHVKDDDEVMSTGVPIRNKLELVSNAGLLPIWRETTKIPLYGKNGKIIGMAGVTRTTVKHKSTEAIPTKLMEVIEHINQNFHSKIYIEALADIANTSVSSLHRQFRKHLNTTPQQYIKDMRLNTACRLLRTSNKPLSEIVMECGYYDQSNMNKAFREALDTTPGEYQRTYQVH